MNFKKFTLLTLLVTTLFTAAFAQRDTVGLNTIITKTGKFAYSFPIEKVYLHLDKPYYAAGDTIWFKAYVTIDKHQPTVLSTNLYVDIANNQDSVVSLVKLPIANGVANGNIILAPDAYKQGNYHLRAYTGWMRNFDADYYYNKTVAIGNLIETGVNTNIVFNTIKTAGKTLVNAAIAYKETGNIALANKKVSWSIVNATGDELNKGKGTTDQNGILSIVLNDKADLPLQKASLTTLIDLGNRKEYIKKFALKDAGAERDVQFFPEGGELTLGIRSKIAFKAVNTNGLGINVKGTVTDNTGAVVANIESQHLGMGVFALMPEEGKSYKATVTFPDGVKATYDMPRVKPAGINLAVFNNQADSLTIKISANDPYFKANQGKLYYIIAQNGGAIYFAAQTTLQSQAYNASIPKSKFPTGVVQLTLLSDRGIPLNERIVFIKNNDMLNVSLLSDKKVYTPRQKVRLSISAKNKALPVEGNFSVSVIDEAKVPFDEDAETTILTNLLLTSDIKGYIEKPNYYFINKDENAPANLDILMLTQGYRRISYRNIITGKYPQVVMLPEQQGLEIAGTLRNNSGMPIAKGNLRLQIPGKNLNAETVTDMVGNFKFSKLSFPDSSQAIISARNNPNSNNLVISAVGDSYQPATKNPNELDAITNIDSTFKPFLENSKKQYDNLHVLKEVVIKASPNVKKPSHNDYGSLMGLPMMADQVISGERVKDCPSLFTCISSYVLGVTALNNNLYLSRNASSQNPVPVQIFANGMPVDFTYLNTIAGNQVETIELFKTDGVSNINRQYQTDGIVSIITRKIQSKKISLAELQEMLPKGNLLNFTAQGYSVAREFYSPRYDPLKPGAFGGDLRSTIFWSPKVKTDKTGTASLSYFNADGKGTYRATIEGFDADGNLGRYILRYTVK